MSDRNIGNFKYCKRCHIYVYSGYDRGYIDNIQTDCGISSFGPLWQMPIV